MKTKILIVEHDPNDIELIQHELKKGNVNYIAEIVETGNAYENALRNFEPDIILSDYSLPNFDGPAAFEIREKLSPHTPFIFVSGTIGEENSIELIKNGVTDYALKDRLFTLTTKVNRAIKEAKEKREKEQAKESLLQSEMNLRAVFDNTDTGFLLLDTSFNIILFNKRANHIANLTFGFKLEENQNFIGLLLPERKTIFTGRFSEVLKGKSIHYETDYPQADGTVSWCSINGNPVFDQNGKVVEICFALNDITERKKAEDQIRELNETLEERVKTRTFELEESNKALDVFSAAVSHDLRAPVRALNGFLNIIKKEYEPSFNPDLKELCGYIDSSGKRINIIIEDLLKLAKYGKANLKLTMVDLNDLVNKVWGDVSFFSSHQAVLEIAKLPKVYADVSLIEQVLVNLLSNAIKYSSKEEKPVIKLGYEKADGTTTIFVKDNGVGFDMKHYNKLFGAFQRLHGMSEFEGTGIGLLLVKQIIEKHGGSVWAESKTGEGAIFYFSLPDNDNQYEQAA